MAIPDWQDAQLKGAVHVRGDSVGSIAPVKPYNPINQRDIDDEMGHVDPDPFGNAYASSSSASKGTPALSPFKSLKSVGFAFSVVLCIALAVVLSKVSPPGMNDGQFDDSGLSALDCSRIQTIGAADFFTMHLVQYATNNDKSGNVSQFEETFSIDIKSRPTLTFIQVKVIDVFWNLVAGQGIRFLMAYVTYRVCSKGILLLVKRWRVSYDFYVSVGLQGTSMMSIYQAFKELLFQPRRRSLRDWLIIVWIVVGMIYTLSVPSLLSAATGYMVPTESWWKMPDDVLVPNLTTATPACWYMGDGSRIGLSNNSYISGPSFNKYNSDLQNYEGGYISNANCNNLTTDFPLFDSISRYRCELIDIIMNSRANKSSTEQDWADTYRNSSTTITLNGTTIDLPAPPLDLIGFQPTDFYNLSSFPNLRQCYKDEEINFFNYTPPMVCVSGSQKYSWGFSRNLSYGILIAQGIWCLSTWLMWLFVTKACQKLLRDTPGPFQAALALTNAMRADLGDKVDEYSEKELAAELGKRPGISVSHVRDSRGSEMGGVRKR